MNVTCALIVISPSKKMLLVHPTFGRQVGGWSFPKGIADEGEEMVDAAIRELFEETGLDVSKFKQQVKPIGRFPYLKEKDIFLAVLELPTEVETAKLFCASCFMTTKGDHLPEVDGFCTASLDDAIKLLSKKQSVLLTELREQLSS